MLYMLDLILFHHSLKVDGQDLFFVFKFIHVDLLSVFVCMCVGVGGCLWRPEGRGGSSGVLKSVWVLKPELHSLMYS